MASFTRSLVSALAHPFSPFVQSARKYNRRKFRRDLFAGLTVSVVELPQSMAYAVIAGVPPQYGIYSSIIQGVFGALLSSSEHVTTGPTNTQSLLIASAAMPLVDPHFKPELYLQVVFMLTLLKGCIQLGLWSLHAGELVQFISRSVLVGISAGAGVLIIVGQTGPMLGLNTAGTSGLPGIVGSISRLTQNYNGLNWYSIGIALGVLGLAFIARRINRFMPGPLIGVVAAGLLVAMMGWESRVAVIGILPHTLPHLQVPGRGLSLKIVYDLLPGALALALLGGIESVAIAKTIAARSGERIVANQEFFAQGFKNALTSFVQCMPGSASFTRSMLDYESGAETRYAAVMNALFVGVLFFAMSKFARYIPMAALAGVLIFIAFRLIDVAFLRRIARADRSDAAVLIITFLAVLFTRLEYAIFIGIFASITFFLRTSSRLHVAEMEEIEPGKFIERAVYDRQGQRQIVFLQLEGDLFFAVADQLQEKLSDSRRDGVRAIILRLKRCHSIDGTALDVLDRFVIDMHRHNGHVLLCGVRDEVMKTLQNYGLVSLIGRDNIFVAERGVFVGARRAIDRARKLIGVSIDSAAVNLSDEFAYDI